MMIIILSLFNKINKKNHVKNIDLVLIESIALNNCSNPLYIIYSK